VRIAIVTDAWRPQVNGVVRTFEQTRRALEAIGHEVLMLSAQGMRSVPCPSYPEIPIALFPGRSVMRALDEYVPHAVHVATEGPVGAAGRRWCLRRHQPFTSSFHTQFPEYIRARVPVPVDWSYAWVRRFHRAAVRTLVPTASQIARLQQRAFANLHLWPRGVDTAVFRPDDALELGLPRPVCVYMGRVAVEKNIEAFLALELPGSKLVIGDGPQRAKLAAAFPDAVFVGMKQGRDLARHVAGGDVFVFPSLTDTFGVVLLEAMACGLAVAAFPVTGPIDVVQPGRTGVLDRDLRQAVLGALALDPAPCVAYARSRSWRAATDTFLSLLAPPGEPASATL
jgi:glycosyltransferase involved in cell wall biosynthesis